MDLRSYWSGHPTLYQVASLRLYLNGQAETTLFGCRGEDHEDMIKGEDI